MILQQKIEGSLNFDADFQLIKLQTILPKSPTNLGSNIILTLRNNETKGEFPVVTFSRVIR